MGNMGTSCLKILYTPNTDTAKIASFRQQTNGFCALSQPYCQVDWWTQLFQGSLAWINPHTEARSDNIPGLQMLVEVGFLLERSTWMMIICYQATSRRLVRPTKIDWPPVVAQSGFRNGEYQVPFLLTGCDWMGVAFQKRRHETERWWNMKISNLPPKKTQPLLLSTLSNQIQ